MTRLVENGKPIEEWHRSNFGAIDDRIVGCKLGEETGEVLAALIRIKEGRANEADLRNEIGDVLVVLAVLCQRHGWNLSEVLEDRFQTVQRRQRWGVTP